MNAKLEELLTAVKLGELVHKKEEEKKASVLWIILAVVGAVALVAAIAYVVYYFVTPDYLEDFDEDFDDFDDLEAEEEITEE